MDKRLIVLFLAGILLLLSSGCATMLSGSSEPVTFDSTPENATISISGEIMGRTPATITLRRKQDQVVEFSKDGYQPAKMSLATKANIWIFANAIWYWACPLSTTTDYSTGAAYEYSPNKFYVALTPVGVPLIGAESRQNTVRTYVVSSYANILNELNTSESEYLKALWALLEIPETERAQAFEKLKAMANDTKDILKFADDVVNAFAP
jgi:hypothetical protein